MIAIAFAGEVDITVKTLVFAVHGFQAWVVFVIVIVLQRSLPIRGQSSTQIVGGLVVACIRVTRPLSYSNPTAGAGLRM